MLHGVRRAGLRCPQDLAVIGADANPSGYVSEPPLTSIAFDAQTIVDTAVAAVLDLLGLPTEEESKNHHSIARLVRRNSS